MKRDIWKDQELNRLESVARQQNIPENTRVYIERLIVRASKYCGTCVIETAKDSGDALTSESIRPELASFALEMEQVLKENDHKSGWGEMGVHQLYSRIKDEFEELQVAYIRSTVKCDQNGIAQAIRKEAIDVSNLCMFLCYNYPKDEEQSITAPVTNGRHPKYADEIEVER